MHKERKETTHERAGERNIHQYIKKISTKYVNNGYKTHVQDINVSKVGKKKDTNNPHCIPQTLPLTKWSYINSPPKNNYHIQNYFPFLSLVTKGKSVK